MQKLRSVHLYLGCVFAPMLLFFAVSGVWQMFGLSSSGLLQTLSTMHTQRPLKSGDALVSPLLFTFVLLMAVSFIVTTILGVVMALKFGRSRRAAIYCLAVGMLVPLSLALIRLLS